MTVRLLVPIDGSDKDNRALQVAGAMARVTDGAIHILRLLDAPATKVSAGMAILGVGSDAGSEERADIEAELRSFARWLASDSPHDVTFEVAGAVDVAAELVRHAVRDADVVIMATRAPGTIERSFLGSVADVIVRQAPCPVIVVPPGARYGEGARIGIRRVLVPLDGSRDSLAAPDRFLELVKPGSVEYVLMQAVRQEHTGGHAMPVPLRDPAVDRALAPDDRVLHVQAEQTETHLRELASRCKIRGDVASIRVVESGDPAKAIVAAVRGELVDLIVMSTRGEGGLQRLMHGSIANRVARESEVPVFLVTSGG
jgi:nucleotide-binding universal stress UspA family protein